MYERPPIKSSTQYKVKVPSAFQKYLGSVHLYVYDYITLWPPQIARTLFSITLTITDGANRLLKR